MEKLAKQLTLRYSFLQSSYWISQCAIYSFAAVYLQAKNFNNTQIGFVLAFAAVLSIIMQPVIAAFADKQKKVTLRTIVLVLMFFVCGLGVLLYLVPGSFFYIMVIYILINAIAFTLNPLFNSLALEYLNLGVPMNYGLARGIGSITFAIMSYILGYLVDFYGAEVILPIFIIGYVLLIASAFLFKLTVPDNLKVMHNEDLDNYQESIVNQERTPSSTGLFSFFSRYKKFSIALVGIAMLFYSHSLINTYLINIMEHVGGGSADMGISLSIAAALELPTMALYIYIVRKIKCSNLLKISAFFFFIKVLLTWLAPNVMTVHISQAFQMFAFALYTPASIYYVNDIMKEHDRVKGQAMLGVASIGIAGTVANITGGKILDSMSVSAMLLVGTVVTAIGFLLICISVEDKVKESV